MEIARAGWIYRMSSVLRRWKRSWLVLYQNGHMAYFVSPDKHQPEEIVVLPGRLAAIHRGTHISNAPVAPEGRSIDSLIQLLASDGEEILMISADNGDDAAAWQFAIDQARAIRNVPAAHLQAGAHQQFYQQPSPGYAYGSPYGVPGGIAYVQQPPTTIIVERDPYYYHPGYYYDPLLGVGTGLALGSMMGWGWHHHGCWW